MKWMDNFIENYYQWLDEQEKLSQKNYTKPQLK